MKHFIKLYCSAAFAFFLSLSFAACSSTAALEEMSSSQISSVDSRASQATDEETESSAPPGEEEAVLTDTLVMETPVPLPQAVTAEITGVYERVNDEIPLVSLPAGTTVSVVETADSLWSQVELEDGLAGYIPATRLHPLIDGAASAETLAQRTVKERLSELRKKLPDGKYWNHMGTDLPYATGDPWSVTDIPCEHDIYNDLYCNFYDGATLEVFPQYYHLCQCLGFASFLSDQIFGADAPATVYYDFNSLRVGDQIRLTEYEHSMIVANIDSSGSVTVAEVNADYVDCLISWDRVLTEEDFFYYGWDMEYITRYPVEAVEPDTEYEEEEYYDMLASDEW